MSSIASPERPVSARSYPLQVRPTRARSRLRRTTPSCARVLSLSLSFPPYPCLVPLFGSRSGCFVSPDDVESVAAVAPETAYFSSRLRAEWIFVANFTWFQRGARWHGLRSKLQIWSTMQTQQQELQLIPNGLSLYLVRRRAHS